ncbi:MAG: DEAD/DEAH box helicase [bacterium]|nr:DEAD/DEAH box helicase [bacterium]
MTTVKQKDLTLRDRLSRLTYSQTCKLLGPQGKKLLIEGGRWQIPTSAIDIGPHEAVASIGDALVRIELRGDRPDHLGWSCSECEAACKHGGAVFALILEEKTALGLARPPRKRTPVEALGEEELVARALADREERARTERMTLRSSDPKRLWTEYTITSAASGKTYRLALRGTKPGRSYCSCPDFRKNTLGTCKHVIHALAKLRRRFSTGAFSRPYNRKRVAIYVKYGSELELRIAVPKKLEPRAARLLRPVIDLPIVAIPDLLERVRKLERIGVDVAVHPDAEQYIEERLMLDRLRRRGAEIRADPAAHALRKELLRVELRPYQLDGIAFAVAAGRAVLADDMGLGKTIQAIGTAELLAREVGISRVLVICPASVKSQWKGEIERFCDRDSTIVLGRAEDRAQQYEDGCFFTICNYEQVLRDILPIERARWDLIVLDEGQRIKNWEAKTAQVIKSLRSPFALVLSGTPLENRVDELYSVVEFIDERRLAPAFRFYNRHRVVDERGKVLGYKNLGELRDSLAPVLLRRTRTSVLDELPPRTTEILRIPPTDEQLQLHNTHIQIVSTIVNKPFISEMDLLRLQKALLMARMSADGTFLVDKQKPGYSSKLQELEAILSRLVAEGERKIVLFTEWTTMLDAIEDLLRAEDVRYVRLDGSVPQKKRQGLVQSFQTEPSCRLFLTTNAGATGLNLQAADTVVNVDLPWNPAILEQRIGRAHRMGQKRPVHVVLLVTEDTIEERMLATLSAKHEVAQAVLDANSEIDAVDLSSGVEELKQRLEVLIGRQPEAAIDESERERAESEVQARAERVALAGGKLVDAAFEFLGEMLPGVSDPDPRIADSLNGCLTRDAGGRPQLTVTLPDDAALQRLAASLSALVGMSGNERAKAAAER